MLAVTMVSLSSNFKAALADPSELRKSLGFVVPFTDTNGDFFTTGTPCMLPWIVWRWRFSGRKESTSGAVLKVLADKCWLSDAVDRAFHEAVRAKRLSHMTANV
jgi:hypothetical protein